MRQIYCPRFLDLRTYNDFRGFSLIEVIVSLFIIGVLVLVIANIPHAIGWVTVSQEESKVREVVAQKVEDVRLTGYDNLANGTTVIDDPRLSNLAGFSGSTVVSDCPAEVCTNGELAKKVSITVAWQENNEPKNYQVNTLIAKDGLR